MPCLESGVSYGMVFQGQPVEGFLDLIWAGILWDPEQPIIVFHPQRTDQALLLLALRGYPRVVHSSIARNVEGHKRGYQVHRLRCFNMLANNMPESPKVD